MYRVEFHRNRTTKWQIGCLDYQQLQNTFVDSRNVKTAKKVVDFYRKSYVVSHYSKLVTNRSSEALPEKPHKFQVRSRILVIL